MTLTSKNDDDDLPDFYSDTYFKHKNFEFLVCSQTVTQKSALILTLDQAYTISELTCGRCLTESV